MGRTAEYNQYGLRSCGSFVPPAPCPLEFPALLLFGYPASPLGRPLPDQSVHPPDLDTCLAGIAQAQLALQDAAFPPHRPQVLFGQIL